MKFTFDLPSREFKLNARAILARGAKAAEAVIVRHFRARPSRSDFFARQVDGTVNTTELTDTHAVVSVASRELAHYIDGGTVRPIPPRKALAIPISERARRAGSPSVGMIPDLFMLKRPGKPPLLCTTEGKTLTMHYVLVKSATHVPHRDAWPTAEIQTEAFAAMQAALDAQTAAS